LAYVTGASSTASCIFCEAAESDSADSHTQSSLVLFRATHTFIILNLFPYNNGHLMVVPRRHIASLAEANADELTEMMSLVRRSEIALMEAYSPHGLNVGINLGRAAGAGVADHLHIHLVPRWNGDTNFMSVVGSVRVLPETLDQTCDRLRPILARLAETP
jgi:ATP adenylyltransferase